MTDTSDGRIAEIRGLYPVGALTRSRAVNDLLAKIDELEAEIKRLKQKKKK